MKNLVRFHDFATGKNPDLRMVRRAVNKIGEDVFPLLFPVCYADIMSQSTYKRKEKLDSFETWKQLYRKVCDEKQCVSLKTLAVTGSDLIDAGLKPGPGLGEMLNRLLDMVLENPECNTKEQLLEIVEKELQK